MRGMLGTFESSHAEILIPIHARACELPIGVIAGNNMLADLAKVGEWAVSHEAAEVAGMSGSYDMREFLDTMPGIYECTMRQALPFMSQIPRLPSQDRGFVLELATYDTKSPQLARETQRSEGRFWIAPTGLNTDEALVSPIPEAQATALPFCQPTDEAQKAIRAIGENFTTFGDVAIKSTYKWVKIAKGAGRGGSSVPTRTSLTVETVVNDEDPSAIDNRGGVHSITRTIDRSLTIVTGDSMRAEKLRLGWTAVEFAPGDGRDTLHSPWVNAKLRTVSSNGIRVQRVRVTPELVLASWATACLLVEQAGRQPAS